MKLKSIKPADDDVHKYTAVFDKDGREKTVHFGAKGMSDYTQHHDPERRARYLKRHRARESWNQPDTAGSLSRHILWGDSTSLAQNIASFRRRFGI